MISSTRRSGNQRRYECHMLRRISLIVVAKRLGIPLADVGIVFETLPADRMPSIRDWQRVSKLWRVQLEDQRKRIDRLEHELTGCIG
nr:MerR family DNA-binding protein [Rhodococcus opacus]